MASAPLCVGELNAVARGVILHALQKHFERHPRDAPLHIVTDPLGRWCRVKISRKKHKRVLKPLCIPEPLLVHWPWTMCDTGPDVVVIVDAAGGIRVYRDVSYVSSFGF